MNDLVAVVTGGTRGIGLAIAESLARRGASVGVTYSRDDRSAEEARGRLAPLLSAGRKLAVLKGDAGDPAVAADHHRQVVRELGAPTVLVNNAGIMPQATFDQLTVADWDRTIRVNLSSAFYWCREVVPGMKRAGFGRIVNISSIAARGGGVIGPHYAASKAGLLGLTRFGARDLGASGITINAIAPAFIEDAGPFTAYTPGQKDALAARTVLGRVGCSADVVRAFEYLLDSPFVTGVCLDVNGGAFMI